MKKIFIISSLVFVSSFSMYAKEDKPKKPEAPPPPPRMMRHHMMMRHGMMMAPRKNPRLKSELQIRARLKERYGMGEEDITIILKARQEILDVMQKYEAPLGDDVPPPPIF